MLYLMTVSEEHLGIYMKFRVHKLEQLIESLDILSSPTQYHLLNMTYSIRTYVTSMLP